MLAIQPPLSATPPRPEMRVSMTLRDTG
eukprot:SAG25_NODE_8560_length_416_cov_0.539432_1_plen_27_part_01